MEEESNLMNVPRNENMFKTLKHKTLPDTYGYIQDYDIYHSSTPTLQPLTATMQEMRKLSGGLLEDALADYDLITVKLVIQ